MGEKQFISTHKLDFESAPYEKNIDPDNDWMRFRVGTCTGLWCFNESQYKVLAIINSSQGNGHTLDVFEWFENSCKRDKKSLKVECVVNVRLRQILLKNGYK